MPPDHRASTLHTQHELLHSATALDSHISWERRGSGQGRRDERRKTRSTIVNPPKARIPRHPQRAVSKESTCWRSSRIECFRPSPSPERRSPDASSPASTGEGGASRVQTCLCNKQPISTRDTPSCCFRSSSSSPPCSRPRSPACRCGCCSRPPRSSCATSS